MKMKKPVLCALCVLLAALLSASCGGGLPEGFEEDAVVARAEEIVGYFNALDFAAAEETVRADLREALSAGKLEEALAQHIRDMGAFRSIGGSSVSGGREADTGADFVTVVLVANYENGKARWTVSLDADMALIGIYMNK